MKSIKAIALALVLVASITVPLAGDDCVRGKETTIAYYRIVYDCDYSHTPPACVEGCPAEAVGGVIYHCDGTDESWGQQYGDFSETTQTACVCSPQ